MRRLVNRVDALRDPPSETRGCMVPLPLLVCRIVPFPEHAQTQLILLLSLVESVIVISAVRLRRELPFLIAVPALHRVGVAGTSVLFRPPRSAHQLRFPVDIVLQDVILGLGAGFMMFGGLLARCGYSDLFLLIQFAY